MGLSVETQNETNGQCQTANPEQLPATFDTENKPRPEEIKLLFNA
jgi:hypothetical protein